MLQVITIFFFLIHKLLLLLLLLKTTMIIVNIVVITFTIESKVTLDGEDGKTSDARLLGLAVKLLTKRLSRIFPIILCPNV